MRVPGINRTPKESARASVGERREQPLGRARKHSPVGPAGARGHGIRSIARVEPGIDFVQHNSVCQCNADDGADYAKYTTELQLRLPNRTNALRLHVPNARSNKRRWRAEIRLKPGET